MPTHIEIQHIKKIHIFTRNCYVVILIIEQLKRSINWNRNYVLSWRDSFIDRY